MRTFHVQRVPALGYKAAAAVQYESLVARGSRRSLATNLGCDGVGVRGRRVCLDCQHRTPAAAAICDMRLPRNTEVGITHMLRTRTHMYRSFELGVDMGGNIRTILSRYLYTNGPYISDRNGINETRKKQRTRDAMVKNRSALVRT